MFKKRGIQDSLRPVRQDQFEFDCSSGFGGRRGGLFSSAGFKLRESQKAVKEKEQAFEELQVQATRLKSLPVLESALRNRQMVEAGNVSYIVLERDAFAANR